MPITAVLSAFNNEVTLSNVVLETLAHAHRVIVLDDGSTDNTAEKRTINTFGQYYLNGAGVRPQTPVRRRRWRGLT